MNLRILSLILILVSLFSVHSQAQAQEQEKKINNLVELSGVVMTSDSLQPVFYCNIGVVGTARGTISDLNGFFSIVMRKGETVQFSAIGYKDAMFSVPDTLSENRYSLIQLMTNDTVNLPETVIYPWPKPHELKSAFLKLDIPDDDVARAKKNLEEEKLRAIAYTMKGDAGENWSWIQRQRVNDYWTYNQPKHINLLNPFAWASFIKAWKNGDFKKKEEYKPD